MLAIGRTPQTAALGLGNIGVDVLPNGKIPVKNEQTNIEHIYALGDVIEVGKLNSNFPHTFSNSN